MPLTPLIILMTSTLLNLKVYSSSMTMCKNLFRSNTVFSSNHNDIDNKLNIKNYAFNRYGEYGSIALEKLQEISPSVASLIVDPGIVLRINEFYDFAISHNLRNSEPWSIRNQFKDFLGTRTVYRGMALTKEEFNSIVNEGLFSKGNNSSNSKSKYSSREEYIQYALSSENILTEFNHHQGGLTFNTQIISVTNSPKVAYAFGQLAGQDRSSRGEIVKVYVFKMEIPELELLTSDSIFRSPTTDYYIENFDYLIGLNRYEFDRKLESFVYYKIDPSEIQNIDTFKPSSKPLIIKVIPKDTSRIRPILKEVWNWFDGFLNRSVN